MGVAVRVKGQTLLIELTARSLARFVELSIGGIDVMFSDNYFDLPAGTTVIVTCPLPDQWTVNPRLSARSLYDTFA